MGGGEENISLCWVGDGEGEWLEFYELLVSLNVSFFVLTKRNLYPFTQCYVLWRKLLVKQSNKQLFFQTWIIYHWEDWNDTWMQASTHRWIKNVLLLYLQVLQVPPLNIEETTRYHNIQGNKVYFIKPYWSVKPRRFFSICCF